MHGRRGRREPGESCQDYEARLRREHEQRARRHADRETRRWERFAAHMRRHGHGHDPGGHPWLETLRAGMWARYLHHRLRRRIFGWFGVTIALSLAIGGFIRADGHVRWWPMVGVFMVMWISSGFIAWTLTRSYVAVVRAARDIGDGKLSTRIPVQRGELGILAGAINDMAMRIEKQMRDQRQLLAVVSHELRTPLGHMRVLLETGRDTGGDPRLIDELEREVLDLDRLVDRLLASSRLEFATLDRRKVDLATIAVAAVEGADVPVDRLAVEGDVKIDGDATLLRRALANLIDNAQVHGGGAVAVHVGRRGDEVWVMVDDAGPGVAADERERMFEAFTRGDNAGNLGLGLALVRRIAVAHGGRAWIEERPGGGARVCLSLPVVAERPAGG